MEFVGQPRLSGACNLLEVPGPSFLDVDDDEAEVVINIRPKSSPLPRRRSSLSDEDSEPEPPLCGSRRVSFADAKGLSLVQVKEFGTWDVPNLPGFDSCEGESKPTEEYILSPLTFSLPLSTEELLARVRDQKMELETIELLPGTTIVKGVVRVLNISFSKAVYIRTTLDNWSSHFDLLAEYIPGSSDGLMDCFSFKLTLVPPFGEQGARVDFCLRYETPVGTFWANNNNRNYVLFCHERMRDKPQKEKNVKKSCLKTVSQNFSCVENIAAIESPSQENVSAVESRHEEEVKNMIAEQTSGGRSGISEEDEQELQTENRRHSSRRSRRKAARMARVRDYFAQREEGANDAERDDTPPETKMAAKEETLQDKHPDVQSFSGGNSKSELSQVVSESLKTCSKSLLDVLSDMSPAHENPSISESEKPESNHLADSPALTAGQISSNIPDNPVHSNDEAAPCQNINRSVTKAEGESHECTNNTPAEPADSVISAVISESLVSQTNSFTFGNVVAPLYHQMFGRFGSESQSVGDRESPAQAPSNIVGLSQSYLHTERKESSYIVPTDVRNNSDSEVQRNVTKTRESKQERLETTPNSPPTQEEESRLSVTADDIPDCTETLQDPDEIIQSDQGCIYTSIVPNTLSGDAESHPHAAKILHSDLLSAQIHTQSSHLRGEARDDHLTCDLQNQTTTGETAQAQLSECACSQIKTNLDQTLSQSEAQDVIASIDPSLPTLQPSPSASEHVSDETDHQASRSGGDDYECVDESNKDEDIDKTITSQTKASSEADTLLEPLHNLNPNQINLSATEETANRYISCCEIVAEKNFSTPETSLENQEETNNKEEGNKSTNNSYEDETKHSAKTEVSDEVGESMTKAMISNHHIHNDMFVDSKDEDTLKDEPIIVSEKIENHEMEAAVIKPEDFSLADTTEVKNWETVVEEEEKNISTDQEEYEAPCLKAKIDTVEKDQGGQSEDARIETVLENRETTDRGKAKSQKELAKELTAVGENGTKAEDAVGLEVKKRVGEEEISKNVAGKDREDVKKELENVQATKTENTSAEEEAAEEIEAEKREEQEETELEKDKYFAEMQEVNIDGTNVQEEEETEVEEEMEIHLNNEASVVWGDQVKPREDNIEEENQNYMAETLVDEAGGSEIIETHLVGMTIEHRQNEVGCFEERLDITQNKVDNDLSAPINSVQDENVIDGERKGENARIPTGMHLFKEGDFQSSENVTHDRSRTENESSAIEGGLCILTDEPESDRTGHDGSSAESDSDDEVELYMHCLRAVHAGAQAGAQATQDRNKDVGFGVGKRPSASRSKLLSTPMPSISESLDEEHHLSSPQDDHEDSDMADVQPTASAPSLSSAQESIRENVSGWKETFSCSNISKTLLYVALLVAFLVVAYHYDFLACFGLYLISVVWLFYQGERQPVKNNRIG